MQKGVKTSEFWVVLVVLVPWAVKALGLEIPFSSASPEGILETIKNANQSDTPVMVAIVYVLSRLGIKWKSVG